MHRFRKKSDAKRNELSSASVGVASSPYSVPLPIVTQQVRVHRSELPSLLPASDFRTSLILPDLTKRFTLLRSSTGNPVSLDDLRTRFAQQRANGAENQISEEEEVMLLDMLSRIRVHGTGLGGTGSKATMGSEVSGSSAKTEPSSASISSGEFASSSTSSTVRQSAQSAMTVSSSAGYDSSVGSASSRTSKRHSNNLFAGQFRDMRYMRKASNRTIGSNRSALSSTPSESTTGGIANALIDSYSDGPFRPVTPENSTPPVSASSSPSYVIPTKSTILSPHSSSEDGFVSLVDSTSPRLSKQQLTNGQLKRMSMSLEEAIKEMEEEADDQVLVPRTSGATQQNGGATIMEAFKASAVSTDDDDSSPPKVIADTTDESSAMNWVADVVRPGSTEAHRSPSPYRAGGSTSPVPRVPGYIPGMPRPVTPAREMDLDDVRSHSTTPRAASPSSTYDRAAATTLPFSASVSSLLRQSVDTSPTPHNARPSSPLASLRAQGGRATPEDRHRIGIPAVDHTSPGSHWRRPSSPLSGNSTAFQSLNSGSRPSTPSNVTWNVSGRTSGTNGRSLGRNGTLLGHSRNQSNGSVTDNQGGGDTFSDTSRGVVRSPQPTYTQYPSSENAANLDLRNKFLSNGSALSTSALAYVEREPSPAHASLSSMSPIAGHDERSCSAASILGDSTRDKQRSGSPFLTPPSSPFAQKFHNNPLLISPMSNNSSRSSLVSAGSSYHSWEEDSGFGAGFIITPDRDEPTWHDLQATTTIVNLTNHNRSGSRGNLTPNDPESILRQFTGLSKLDLLSIQKKLLDAAQIRAKSTETRSPSALRRRRPSTAQSVQSAVGQQSRTTSPVPQLSKYEIPWTTDTVTKASALLASVVDSIGQPGHRDNELTESEESEVEMSPPAPLTGPLATSSPGRRNKDLADILFGSNDTEPVPPLSELTQKQAREESKGEEEHDGDTFQPVTPKAEGREFPQLDLDKRTDTSAASVVNTTDTVDLMRQVQERTEAAMAQLRRSPQQARFQSPGTRKKIHLQDISGPLLVQSSTSIDKIPTVPASPLKSPQADPQRTIKLSFSKRLRKTLRSKNTQPNGDEVTPWMVDGTSTSLAGSPIVGNRSLTPLKANTMGHGSMTDLNSPPKPSNVSPPASAGPSLKHFMSIFRKKGQADGFSENDQRTASMASPNQPPMSTPAIGRHSFQLPPSAPLLARSGSVSQGRPIVALTAPSLSRQPTETPTIVVPSSSSTLSPPSEPGALKQFYEAAQSLGLDQAALNEFLARSQPGSGGSPEHLSSATLARSNSAAARSSVEAPRALSPLIPEVFVERPPVDLSRNASQRQYAGSPVPAAPRRVRELVDPNGNSRNTVVRRTIIFPSTNGSTVDVSSLARKTSRKRASGLSVQSNRSVYDRVPTPPPLKAKRQSADPSPPVPNLPTPSRSNQGSRATSRLTPEAPVEKLNSLYDSFYDMYTGDRTGNALNPELHEPPKSPTDEDLPEMEEGQALEVIELANGETIWSIVNGLRADDTESIYPRRGSLDSEYSSVPPNDNDTEQLFFKEHMRTGSKGSSISNFAKRRSQAANRPETKVFYSSSAHIARLIEQLSHSTEAASFNIRPKDPPVSEHSRSGSLQTDSDVHWTVEENLEHTLDYVNATI